MASGVLGQVSIAQTSTNTTVYTVPASTFAVVTINVLNRSSTDTATARIAIAATSTPSNSEYIEYDASITANGVLERTGVVLNATKNIVASASTTSVSISVYGIEETV